MPLQGSDSRSKETRLSHLIGDHAASKPVPTQRVMGIAGGRPARPQVDTTAKARLPTHLRLAGIRSLSRWST
jgi:hypothetical protein